LKNWFHIVSQSMTSLLAGFTKQIAGDGTGSTTPKKDRTKIPPSTELNPQSCDLFENYSPFNPYDNHRDVWKQNRIDILMTGSNPHK